MHVTLLLTIWGLSLQGTVHAFLKPLNECLTDISFTLYGVFVEGICVDFVLLIRHKHTLIADPVFPQYPFNGRREVWDLKHWLVHL